ncbi:hypothetical protein Dacsa_2096 [Dactylococcopsis salina PCC 8305]|uniref:Uncharacterized protein n=1 Tax=Dactylococcopsis salina (strain PCC 8305) TaxID=13035 RepID=K9YXC2_DACS8|nr:hypothetical protein Dacsa_2096 [Dactylococcopsis salina PCC 8305]
MDARSRETLSLAIFYAGLTPELDFIQNWANLTGINPEELTNGVAALLDMTRRSGILLDREGGIFSNTILENWRYSIDDLSPPNLGGWGALR